MKRLLFVFSFFVLFQHSYFSTTVCVATTQESYYAKVEYDSVYFYSLPIKSESHQLFEIPASYYVLLTGNENQDFYKAKYSDIEGYVLKNSVQAINETPNYPYAMSSFRNFSLSSLSLKSQPTLNSEDVAIIPSGEYITTYYGKKIGEEIISDSTNIWYYCAYGYENQLNQGYFSAYYCDHFQKIIPNNEAYTPVTTEIFKEEENILSSPSQLSTTAKALIAVGCSIPCLIIILLLLRKKSNNNQKAPKIVRRPKRDFYEFNEDDI